MNSVKRFSNGERCKMEIFVSLFPDDQPQKEMKTVMNLPVEKIMNQYFRW
jgi:hypothetical protein